MRAPLALAAVGLALASALAAPAASADTATAPGFGTFSAVCEFSHRAADDPIVLPKMPGYSHMHDFFGNRSTDAFSTNARLRRRPTKCTRPGDHSAYWSPTLASVESVDAFGEPVEISPNRAQAYYMAGARDPATIRPFPRGLKLVAGNVTANPAADLRKVGWFCSAVGGIAPKVMEAEPPPCDPGLELYGRIFFPDCSNGEADSRNHRRHMAYSEYLGTGRFLTCPRSHPIPVPALRLTIAYPANAGVGTELSSGGRFSLHADFFEAWRGRSLERLIGNCLAADVTCGASAAP